jgi:hypothetical protein
MDPEVSIEQSQCVSKLCPIHSFCQLLKGCVLKFGTGSVFETKGTQKLKTKGS